MAEYLSAGVFVEERAAGPAVISGVSTSTGATVGWLQRGPVGKPILVTGFDNFVDKFGSYWTNSYVPYAMAAFFSNGGSRAYIVREVPADAVKATCNIEDPGQVAQVVGWRIPAAGVLLTSGTDSDFDLTIDAVVDADVDMSGGVTGTYTATQIAAAINAAATGTSPASVVTDPDGWQRVVLTSPTADSTSAVDVSVPTDTFDGTEIVFGGVLADTGADAVLRWSITAENEGAWGNLLKACLVGNDGYRDTTLGGYTKFDLIVSEESADGVGDYVVQEQIGPFDLDTITDPKYFLDVVNAASDYVRVAGLATPGIPWELTPSTIAGEFLFVGDASAVTFTGYLYFTEILRDSVTITDGTETFTDDGLGVLTGSAGGSGTIDYTTGAYSLTFNAAPAATPVVTAGYIQVTKESEACCALSSGTDGTVGLTRGLVTDPALSASRRGIYAFDQIEEILQVFLPDFAGSVVVANDLIAWAEAGLDRFILLDPASDLTPQEVLEYRQFVGAYNSSYAALHYPWVTIADSLSEDRPMNMPPSAFVAGVIARTDQQRNVGKAPAGINDGRLLLAIGMEYDTSKGERDLIYPANINPLMDSPQTGRAVWGARTLSLDAEWKYIQVRRLFMFLEKSTFLATHWAVFESNNAGLWARISASLNSFMLNLHDEGYFAGQTPEESFAVVCDSTNNSQADIDLGLVTCDIYAAPNKPGEFIRFRFQQKVNQSA